MFRRFSTAALASVSALILTIALTFNWAYTEIFTTSRFVNTAQQISDDPAVEQEISQAIVNAFTGDTALPPVLLIPLQKAADEIVASDAFHTFWSDALWDIHQPLVKQLKSDTPLNKVEAVRVNLTSFVNTLLQDIRSKYPTFASVLPKTAPLTEFQLLDGENLENARTVVRLLTATRWLLIALAVALLAALILLSRKRAQPFRASSITLAVGSAGAMLMAILLPNIATSFVSADHSETARAITTNAAQSLRLQSLVIMVLSLGIVGTSTVLHRRRAISTP